MVEAGVKYLQSVGSVLFGKILLFRRECLEIFLLKKVIDILGRISIRENLEMLKTAPRKICNRFEDTSPLVGVSLAKILFHSFIW